MKRSVILVLFWACILSVTVAQDMTSSPSLKRTVLMTLNESQGFSYNEFSVNATLQGNNYAILISNKLDQSCLFIINGDLLQKFETTPDYFGNYIYMLDLSKKDGYGYVYKEGTNFYINHKGQKDGPFDEVQIFRIDSANYAYAYKLMGFWYENIQGTITGPFTNNFPHYSSRDVSVRNVFNWDPKFSEVKRLTSEDGKTTMIYNYEYNYVVINGKKYGNCSPLSAIYNKESNSFLWNGFEGMDIVVYEYKL